MPNEDKARQVADRIAARLQTSGYDNDWDDLQARLDRMYQDIQNGGQPAMGAAPAFIPKTKLVQINGGSHPSQERFNVNEAIVDELVEFFEKEKACSFEPNGKPCDHCAMCSSRGF